MKKLIILLFLRTIVSVDSFSFDVPRIISALFQGAVTKEEPNIDPDFPNHFCSTGLASNLQNHLLENIFVILEFQIKQKDIRQSLIEASSPLITKEGSATYKLTLLHNKLGNFVPIPEKFANANICAFFSSYGTREVKLELRICCPL